MEHLNPQVDTELLGAVTEAVADQVMVLLILVMVLQILDTEHLLVR